MRTVTSSTVRSYQLVFVMTAAMLVACESAPAGGASSTAPSGGGLATPSSFPGAVTDSPIPSAGGWVTYANHLGEFTFSAPEAWHASSCEDQGAAYVVAAHEGALPPPCGRGEYEQAWLIFESVTGDQRPTSSPSLAGTVTGAADVSADGVRGVRYTATVHRTEVLPPPNGANQIYYVFFNGRRTYTLRYDHWPTDPDRSADFDRLVQQTLRFSA